MSAFSKKLVCAIHFRFFLCLFWEIHPLKLVSDRFSFLFFCFVCLFWFGLFVCLFLVVVFFVVGFFMSKSLQSINNTIIDQVGLHFNCAKLLTKQQPNLNRKS